MCDLVKSHLMLAVREEVELLREQIRELQERNRQLERENHTLRPIMSKPLATKQRTPRGENVQTVPKGSVLCFTLFSNTASTLVVMEFTGAPQSATESSPTPPR
uniref:cGMP-dependent protein kinase N-terminal coiled-coil domain-containing protein n=1 Tax=Oreochromis aureus TaxID=47969 RepID=A0AAZ1XUB3_OREAU